MLIDNKVLICVGSGGVGKTTVSASLGIMAAQSGLNVLVMTIVKPPLYKPFTPHPSLVSNQHSQGTFAGSHIQRWVSYSMSVVYSFIDGASSK